MPNTIHEIWTALPNGFVKGGSLLKLSLLVTFRLTTDPEPPPNLTLWDFIEGKWDSNWTTTVSNYAFMVNFGNGSVTVQPDKKILHPQMWDALFGNPRALKVKAYKAPAKGVLSKAEILTYRSDYLSERLESAYVRLANTKTRLRAERPEQMRLADEARRDITSLVDDINIYALADPTEEERLTVLTALKWLDEDTANNREALAWREFYLGRISRNGGRDLLLATVKEVHQKIKNKVSTIQGPNGQSGPGPILLRAQPQGSPQPSPQPSPAAAASANFSTDFAIFHSAPDSEAMHAASTRATRTFDFHEMLTMVGNYPVLMRRLGLVIDVEIDPGALPAGEETGFVRVTQAGVAASHPRTAYQWTPGRRIFIPKSGTPRIKEGLLDLSDRTLFSIQTADTDGALMKQFAHASNARRGKPDGPEDVFKDVVEEDLEPTLRTQGVSVLFKDIDKFLQQLLENAENKSCQPNDCEFHAEDLIKGFRVDIQEVDIQEVDSNNAAVRNWYSLCERNEKYYFTTPDNRPLFEWPASGTYEGEGVIGMTVTKPEVTQAMEAANLKVLQQHQSLFRWENWSLCVEFPQKALDAKRKEVKPESAPLRLRPKFTVVDKSLPKLRFGKKYRVRCRMVDPAGNSRRRDEIGEKELSSTIGLDLFARYEAIAPPVLLVDRPIDPSETPGDQLNRLVLRDGDGSTLRCVAPPRVTAMTSIVAGAYDNGVSPSASAFVGAMLNEAGEFPRVENDDPAYKLPHFRYSPSNAEPPRQPYLPDPFTAVACLAMSTVDDQKPIFGNMSENELICGYFHNQEKWPHAQPFIVRLVPANPQRTEIARLVQKSPNRPFVTMAEVSLTPGEIIKLKLSSGMNEGDLGKMAFFHLAPLQGEKPSQELAQRIICGEHPHYTPFIDVMLVHAVKKPLPPLEPLLVPALRKPGDTALDLAIAVRLHRNSTGKVECEARWEEPVDDVSQPFCTTRHGAAIVADEKIKLVDKSLPDPTPHLPFQPQYKITGLHNFGDTKHRHVTYSLRATTRFREYYPPSPKAENPEQEEDIQQKERNRYSIEFGPTEVNVLSTARPPVPNLAYVIPTFRWEQSVTKKVGSDSHRWGGGLRIYLERPWFASGVHERLAIVLYPGTLTGPLCKFMAPFITQWGRDPIWGLEPPTGKFPMRKLNPFPGRNDFRWRGVEPHYKPGLVLQAFEKVDPTQVGCTSGEELEVAVLAFEPEFDQERGLWRCDIEINPAPAYFPFVRLALARYQEHALEAKENDCRISSVVQADFMQLTPDRWANLRYESDRMVNVTVTGFSYQSRRAETDGDPVRGTGVMRVAVEERCKNRDGSLRWQRLETNEPNGHIEPSSVSSSQDGETIWNFRIALPHSRKTRRYRVVILESEEIAKDVGIDHLAYDSGFRIVYADILGV
jgi:hypothetical protein